MSNNSSHGADKPLEASTSSADKKLVVGDDMADSYPPPSSVDIGKVENRKVTFEPWRSPADTPSPPPPAPLPPEQRIGFAIVGLGRLALEEILPAFSECMNAKVVALVSGTPEKLDAIAMQYGIRNDHCYSYENFDAIADNPEIQAVYIVLPNGMHREFTERAARAGKHVLCEKPMSVSSQEAKRMVDVCKAANVKLMIAYRIQYEGYNARLAQGRTCDRKMEPKCNRVKRRRIRSKFCSTVDVCFLSNLDRRRQLPLPLCRRAVSVSYWSFGVGHSEVADPSISVL